MNEKEIWDAYYENEKLANIDLIRGEKIPDGLYHIVCEVLVKHKDGTFLLTKRDLKKQEHPGEYEATSGGSCLKGEDKFTCIKRELLEETGINTDNFIQIFKSYTKDSIIYSFFCEVNIPKDSIIMQKGETIEYKWVKLADFLRYLNEENGMVNRKRRIKMGVLKCF